LHCDYFFLNTKYPTIPANATRPIPIYNFLFDLVFGASVGASVGVVCKLVLGTTSSFGLTISSLIAVATSMFLPSSFLASIGLGKSLSLIAITTFGLIESSVSPLGFTPLIGVIKNGLLLLSLTIVSVTTEI
jgi:hypothetical protein